MSTKLSTLMYTYNLVVGMSKTFKHTKYCICQGHGATTGPTTHSQRTLFPSLVSCCCHYSFWYVRRFQMAQVSPDSQINCRGLILMTKLYLYKDEFYHDSSCHIHQTFKMQNLLITGNSRGGKLCLHVGKFVAHLGKECHVLINVWFSLISGGEVHKINLWW